MAACNTTNKTDRCRDELPPCPVCGGLECLCRPRFFPGQLLSDEDLNRLQRYITGKNKLHNRYLHGWGVACGLEVVCDPCKPTNVVVRTGYALSPCGDDIVLCGDQSVNVCDLIAKCREREPVCDPPYNAQPAEQCLGGTQQWVLAVCYDEKPSRGVTALSGAGDTVRGGGDCGCGGSGTKSSGGSCGCGGKAASKASTAGARKNPRPQCEPTQICEGYIFKAYKLPPTENRLAKYPLLYGDRSALMSWTYGNRATLGPLLDRVLCCMLAAMDMRAQVLEGKITDARSGLTVYADYVEALREFARDFALHDCTALTRMNTIVADAQQFIGTVGVRAPSAAEQDTINSRLQQLDDAWIGLVAECLCSALLPACPEPATDNCVPLAVITLEKRDCRIVEICNWQARKLLITWPTITYWLSWLPWDQLKAWIARLCCPDTRNGIDVMRMLQLSLGIAAIQTHAAAPQQTLAAAGARDTAKSLLGLVDSAPTAAGPRIRTNIGASAEATGAAAAATGTRDEPASSDSITLDSAFVEAMSAPNLMQHTLAAFEKLVSGTDKTAPEWASLAARVVAGRAFAPLAGDAAVTNVKAQDLASHLGVTRLATQVEALQKTVAAQQQVIDALQIINRK